MTWTAGDHIIYSTGDDHLFTVPAAGGSVTTLLERDTATETDFHEPSALPDGRGLLFVVHAFDGDLDKIDVLTDKGRHTVFHEDGAAIFKPMYADGHILFARTDRNKGLWALPFSLTDLTASGDPILISSRGTHGTGSPDGLLLFGNVDQGESHRIVFVDRAGVVTGPVGDPIEHADNTMVSPDGQRVAACIEEGNDNSLWVYDLERGSRSRLLFDADCGSPRGGVAWSPDGESLFIGRMEDKHILRRRADGSAEAEVVVEGLQPAVSADGRLLVFVRESSDTQADIWVVGVDGPDEPVALLATPAREEHPAAAPDGGLLAYTSNASGRPEIYLREFPDGEGLWQVSADGGDFPRWSDDGTRLYFLQDEVAVMEVRVTRTPRLRLSDPVQLWISTVGQLGPGHGFDVFGNGERFVAVELGGRTTRGGDLTLISGWQP
jgi:Tol biopolymer transport system component